MPAKISFVASKQTLVDTFCSAAVTAGGSIRSSPSEGSDESTYYSATVLDPDSNIIGVMYRPHGQSVIAPDAQRIDKWQKDVALSSLSRSKPQTLVDSTRIIVNNITTTPAMEVHRLRAEPKDDVEISTRAIIGTLLGASAGAAVAYAMAKNDPEKPREIVQKPIVGRAIENSPPKVTEIIYDSGRAAQLPLRPIQLIDREAGWSTPGFESGSRVKTVASSHRTAPTYPIDQRAPSHSGRTIAHTQGTKILIGNSEHQSSTSRPRRSSAGEKTEGISSKTSLRSPSVKTAKDIPLPASKVSTNLTPSTDQTTTINDLATVVPEDSISQVSTKRSSNHHSRHSHHHHRHHSKSSHPSKHSRQTSHGSGKTVKPSDYHSSKSHRR